MLSIPNPCTQAGVKVCIPRSRPSLSRSGRTRVAPIHRQDDLNLAPRESMSVPSPESPGSDQSPLTVHEGRTSYFSSPLSSPRLGSIPEHVEAQQVQPDGDAEGASARASVSSITFRFESLPKGEPKHRKDRIRTSSPPAPR